MTLCPAIMGLMDERPANARDVAAAVIESATDVDQMKLHKLLYYAQAWYLAWYGEPLFRARIEAWEHGPYVPRVGRVYREGEYGRDLISEPMRGDSGRLSERQMTALESVVQAYDSLAGTELADLTKKERPWHEARGDRPAVDSTGRDEITPESLMRFYRTEAVYGAREPELTVRPELRERARRGDTDAVREALDEALRVG